MRFSFAKSSFAMNDFTRYTARQFQEQSATRFSTSFRLIELDNIS